MLGDYICGLAQLDRGLELAFCGYDFGTTLTLGFGFLCHCPLHIVRQCDVFYLHSRHLRTPRLGMRIDDVFYLHVDIAGLRQELVERELADYVPDSRLADLVDCIVYIFNSYD